ncbi:MAG: aminodeoxychorismate/anthranilate synthase component II [Bacillota bacterium]
MVLIIDNYDSFAYNLYQYVGICHDEVTVLRNDKVTIKEIEEMAPSHIIISPGPGFPKDAGISGAVVKHFAGKIPILGVCLGHQTIGEVFGGEVVHAKELMHGKHSMVDIDNKCAIFKGLPTQIQAARYHSLIVSRERLPQCLEITAEEGTGVIMALKHRDFEVYGVQFHPESILTPEGIKIIQNFLEVRA